MKNLHLSPPQGSSALFEHVKAFLKTASLSLSTIFFISHPWIGGILWVTLLLNPRYAIFSILGVVIAIGVKKLFKNQDTNSVGGDLKANALLAALMVAWLTEVKTLPLMTEIAIVSIATLSAALLTLVISRLLKNTSLPPLVLGYCVVALMLFNICPNCFDNGHQQLLLPTTITPADWPTLFLQALGSFIYTPTIEAGLLISLAILLWSRIMFITGVLGWSAGVFVALSLETLGTSYYWLPISYNFFLTGMALGAAFILPGRKSLLIAMLGGALTAFLGLVIQQWFSYSPSAFLPLSATISIWLFIAIFSFTKTTYVQLNTVPHLRPEDAWRRIDYWSRRFGQDETLFSCPVAGEVHISQGINGTLSHSGNWRYALDFQRPITIDYSLDPTLNIWGAPVYAPASGVIEQTRSSVIDNELGMANFAENWGNYVMIRLDQGGWAILAHLQQNSITLGKGVRVTAGDYLGRVGNSGRSPIPHLHLQAQTKPQLGAPTQRFRMVNYLTNTSAESPLNHWVPAGVPSEGDIIIGAHPNQSVHSLLASSCSGSAIWSIETQGEIPQCFKEKQNNAIIRINVTLDSAGRFLFRPNQQSETLIVNLSPDAWRIIETDQLTTPFLKLLALCMPSIPYAATEGMTWHDLSPLITEPSNYSFNSFFGPYIEAPFSKCVCRCNAVPTTETNVLEIETHIEPKRAYYPYKLNCQIKQLNGPSRLQADFAQGSITYTLLSFEPNLPLDNTLDNFD